MYPADDETKRELIDAFHELYEQLEADLDHLSQDPSPARLGSIFRAIHNIKGHAGMLGYETLVHFSHTIEDLAECLRSHKIEPTPQLCECLLLGLDRLKDLHYRDILGHNYPELNEQAIQLGFQNLAEDQGHQVEAHIDKLMMLLTGGFTPAGPDLGGSQTTASGTYPRADFAHGNDRKLADLAFFQELSFQLDAKNPQAPDRSILLYDWGQKLNHRAGDIVDYQQLAAATYMHDVGLAFIARCSNEVPKTQVQDKNHVRWGYDILIRMPGWEEAALIVLGHHERVDGSGYPNGLHNTLIHPGSKILAILDAFFDSIRGRVDASQRRSILRAMAQINAGRGSQFDEMWVDLFNEMIKEEVRQGRL